MTAFQTDVDAILRDIIETHGEFSVSATSILPEDDLYRLGLSSVATVSLMLAIEKRFEIVIPDEALTRATFQSIASLTALIRTLRDESRA